MEPPGTVDFWFDPSCPYTFVASLWLREVATVRPIEVGWHVMSLSVLNEGRGDDPEGDPEGYLWVPARICAAVQQEHGHAALGRFYAELWRDEEGEGHGDWLGDFHTALDRTGLPRELAEAGSTSDYDETLRASHAEGTALVGTHVGTPIVAADRHSERPVAFFGPVLSRVPRGEEAGRLWDGALLVAATTGFHEMKGPAPAAPVY
ncbi:hypothetical protein F4561_004627 [Lipingzhangella halophila]|uniref:DSBA-like thioredoxin domain-containing protein n=1 Tax=Lipingzhangella halophila TaxID=1783352 RepID=A0A7W7W470_9ACTN|nr:disulfide bond formation protein DsbA [Lipingzhangella halophila]MBB4933807.1 hypothetical protein [Lipingzhangella halophila]